MLLGILEAARVLLKLEGVRSRLEQVLLPSLDRSIGVETRGLSTGAGEGDSEGGSSRSTARAARRRAQDLDEEARLSWKIGCFMDIFLSPEIQVRSLGTTRGRAGEGPNKRTSRSSEKLALAIQGAVARDMSQEPSALTLLCLERDPSRSGDRSCKRLGGHTSPG